MTTVLKLVDKPALIQWAADLSIRWANQNWSVLATRNDLDAYKAGRYRWKDVRDERASIGTTTHEWAEADLTGGEHPEIWNHEESEAIAQWQRFHASHWVEPRYVEATVWSHKYGYAGTLDLVADVDGVLTLIDLKTSKNVWEEHKIQMAALANADVFMVKDEGGVWTEEPMIQFEEFRLLQLRPRYHDPLLGIDIPAFYEYHSIEKDEIPLLFEKFKGYLNVWNADQKLKALRKQKEAA